MNKPPIVSVVEQYVELKRRGKDLWGLCPFHAEKTASFSVSEAKELFCCFGCGEKGDVIKFVQLLHKVDFREAVKLLQIEKSEENRAEIERKKEQRASDSAWRNQSLNYVAGVLRRLRREAQTDAVRREIDILETLSDDIALPESVKSKRAFNNFLYLVKRAKSKEKINKKED